MLRLLADRHHDLVAERTGICRFHACWPNCEKAGPHHGFPPAGQRVLGPGRRWASPTANANASAASCSTIRHLDQMLADLRQAHHDHGGLVEPPSPTSTGSGQPAPPFSSATPAASDASHCGPLRPLRRAAPPSTPPAGRSNATASTPAGTANSTMLSTSPLSPKRPTTPRDGPTTSARSPKDNPAKKLSAPSSDGSATPSTAASSTTLHTGPRGQPGTTPGRVTSLTP